MSKQTTKSGLKPNHKKVISIIIGVVVVAAALAAIYGYTHRAGAPGDIRNFAQCIKAGGARLESYPERCMLNGREFVNEDQKVQFDASDYIGMSEQAAISRAESEGRAARVIERDGQSLPMTMDLVMGRLNLTIENGQVSRVDVETVD